MPARQSFAMRALLLTGPIHWCLLSWCKSGTIALLLPMPVRGRRRVSSPGVAIVVAMLLWGRRACCWLPAPARALPMHLRWLGAPRWRGSMPAMGLHGRRRWWRRRWGWVPAPAFILLGLHQLLLGARPLKLSQESLPACARSCSPAAPGCRALLAIMQLSISHAIRHLDEVVVNPWTCDRWASCPLPALRHKP